MDLSKEPEFLIVNGLEIRKPKKPSRLATIEAQIEFGLLNMQWNKALRETPWGFESQKQKEAKIKNSSITGKQNRRAKMKDVFVESVDLAIVSERDNWICGICNHSVSKLRDRNLVDIASLDHIIPISKGGEHSYANTQLAHLSCNIRKGAKTPKL